MLGSSTMILLTTLLIIGAAADEQGWVVAPRSNIDYDLETTPLQIKTNSTLGSGDNVYVRFRDSQRKDAGGVHIRFNSPLQYYLDYCFNDWNNWPNFPTDLPAATDKVWRISKTRTSGIRLVIHCNEQEVLNILLSDSMCSYYHNGFTWSSWWSRKVAKIYFNWWDTASDYYRSTTGWLAVLSGGYIDYDLETTPIQIKTNSTIGSGDEVSVHFWDLQSNYVGGVWIKFNSPPQYHFQYCFSSDRNFPTDLPTATEKVWKITLIRTSGIRVAIRVVIHCNEQEVLNFSFSSSCQYYYSYWSSTWIRKVTKILFSYDDTVSVYLYYRSTTGNCTGLKAEWRGTIETTAQFPVDAGTVVKVTCSESGARNTGSSELTCVKGTEFFYLKEPSCLIKPGNYFTREL